MSSPLLPLEEALTSLLALAEKDALTTCEQVPLHEADGRVLAEDLLSAVDLPPWPNSAMDGYALRLSDLADQPLVVSQRVFAGSAPEPLQAGTCARIFTGAPVPPGADVIEMQENTAVGDDGRVSFLKPLREGQNIRPQGQESRTGDRLLSAGTRLGPIELGVAASTGAATLSVRPRLRVAVISTGDELQVLGQPLQMGQIYNSNRPLLLAWLARLGCEPIDAGCLPDDLQVTRDALASLKDVDLILSTGAVSVGEADFLGQVLREEGELAFWKIAIKPGKPLTCGYYRGIPMIGLPGNPASSLVTFAMLARPYLLRRMGVTEVMPLGFDAPAGFTRDKAQSRREFLRVRLENGCIVPYPNQSSGVLLSASWANGLAEIRENTTVQEGERIRFIPYSALLH